MPGQTFTIEGIREFEEAMQEIIDRLGPEYATEVAESAVRIRDGAKQRVPVDTGLTRSQIGFRLRRSKAKGTVSAVVGTEGSDYARFVEFATVRTDEQPFLTPAALQEVGVFFRGAVKATSARVAKSFRKRRKAAK